MPPKKMRRVNKSPTTTWPYRESGNPKSGRGKKSGGGAAKTRGVPKKK